MSNIVFGLPIGNVKQPTLLGMPYGGHERWMRVFEVLRFRSAGDYRSIMAEEHSAILATLLAAQVEFRAVIANIAYLPSGYRNMLSARGVPEVVLPDIPNELLLYPRDLAINIGRGLIDEAVVHDPVFTFPLPKGMVASPYGTGGKIHMRGNVALVPWRHQSRLGGVFPAQKEQLESFGLCVGVIPNAYYIIYDLAKGEDGSTEVDDHIDRSSGLIQDNNGGLHLFVDADIVIATEGGPVLPPDSIDHIRRIAEPLQVTVHTVRGNVPGSLGFCQLPDGRVIVTGGDEPLFTALSSVVPESSIVTTPIPIVAYPLMVQAGVRCLIGDWPDGFA